MDVSAEAVDRPPNGSWSIRSTDVRQPGPGGVVVTDQPHREELGVETFATPQGAPDEPLPREPLHPRQRRAFRGSRRHLVLDWPLPICPRPSRCSTGIAGLDHDVWHGHALGRSNAASQVGGLANFTQRHFLTAPLRRLQKGGWAQLKFSDKKTLAWATKGERLKDSYRVHGKAILKLVTSEGDSTTR